MLGLGASGELAIGEVSTGATTGAEFIGPDKYMQLFRDPVWSRPALRAGANPFASFNPIPVVPFGWLEPLSDPVRTRPRAPAALYPNHFWQPAPSPFAPTGWFNWLSDPVRTKPGIATSRQQFLAYQANPTTVTPFAWFAPLSDPVRVKPGLRPGLQQFFAADTTPIPVTRLIGWFASLSIPVRIKPGLRAALQQFLAHPPQLRPTPTSFAVLNATETKDVFLAGVTDWNAIASGEAGVVIITAPGSEAGIAQANTAPPIASAAVSIIIV